MQGLAISLSPLPWESCLLGQFCALLCRIRVMGKRYRCIMYLHLFTDICITYQGVDAEDGSVRGEHVMGLVKDFNKVAMSVLKDAERDGRLELSWKK